MKFAEDQDPVGVLKRTKFMIEFITKLGEVFGQDTEAAVLWVVKNVAFNYDGDFGSAGAWRLLLVLNHVLVRMDWKVPRHADDLYWNSVAWGCLPTCTTHVTKKTQ